MSTGDTAAFLALVPPDKLCFLPTGTVTSTALGTPPVVPGGQSRAEGHTTTAGSPGRGGLPPLLLILFLLLLPTRGHGSGQRTAEQSIPQPPGLTGAGAVAVSGGEPQELQEPRELQEHREQPQPRAGSLRHGRPPYPGIAARRRPGLRSAIAAAAARFRRRLPAPLRPRHNRGCRGPARRCGALGGARGEPLGPPAQ